MKAMEMLLKKEKGDKNILIMSAILHDVGWSKVPVKLQLAWRNKELKRKAEEQHLEFAGEVIRRILHDTDLKTGDINKIVAIAESHLFKNPRDIEKRLLIDADNLSDIFKEQFYTDVREYKVTEEVQLEFRRKNKFYTKTAQTIFDREFKMRAKEIKKKL